MTARMLKLAAALAAGVAVLVCGAWTGGALEAHAQAGRPSRATDEFAYDRALETGSIPVGDELEVNGQPMQLSIVYTDDAPVRVVSFYTHAFVERELIPIVQGEGDMMSVASFDRETGTQRFVNAMRQQGAQTLVMLGVTNPRRPPQLFRGAAAAGFPVPPENRAFLGFRSEDAGAHADSGQFVTSLSGEAVAAFYRRELAAKGWVERGQSQPAYLVFQKAGEVLSVAIQALEDRKSAAVFVNHTQGGLQ